MTPPKTPFATSLSGSARTTRLRLLRIFRGPRKGPPAPLVVLILLTALVCAGLVSCQTGTDASSDSGLVFTDQGEGTQTVLTALAP